MQRALGRADATRAGIPSASCRRRAGGAAQPHPRWPRRPLGQRPSAGTRPRAGRRRQEKIAPVRRRRRRRAWDEAEAQVPVSSRPVLSRVWKAAVARRQRGLRAAALEVESARGLGDRECGGGGRRRGRRRQRRCPRADASRRSAATAAQWRPQVAHAQLQRPGLGLQRLEPQARRPPRFEALAGLALGADWCRLRDARRPRSPRRGRSASGQLGQVDRELPQDDPERTPGRALRYTV
jgi:hypothetical protein